MSNGKNAITILDVTIRVYFALEKVCRKKKFTTLASAFQKKAKNHIAGLTGCALRLFLVKLQGYDRYCATSIVLDCTLIGLTSEYPATYLHLIE